MFTKKTHLEFAELINKLCFGDKRKRKTVKSELISLIKMHNLNYYEFAVKLIKEDLNTTLDYELLYNAFCNERQYLRQKERV